MYQHDAQEAYEKLHPKIYNPRWYAILELKRLIRIMGKQHFPTNPNTTLLDYGCGSKPYKPLFAAQVGKYIGADIALNPEKDVLVKADGTIDLPDNQSDILLSTQVLEHVTDPNLYLKESYRILKKNGILLLSTHGIWMYHPDPQDYWRWTSGGLRKIVSEAGFDILEFKGMMGRASIGLQLFQDGFIFKLPKFILPLFCFLMQLAIKLADKTTTAATRDQDAANYVLIAKVRK